MNTPLAPTAVAFRQRDLFERNDRGWKARLELTNLPLSGFASIADAAEHRSIKNCAQL